MNNLDKRNDEFNSDIKAESLGKEIKIDYNNDIEPEEKLKAWFSGRQPFNVSEHIKVDHKSATTGISGSSDQNYYTLTDTESIARIRNLDYHLQYHVGVVNGEKRVICLGI